MGPKKPEGALILRDIGALRLAVAGWRASGEIIALTPTMGALHAGHVSLVEMAKRHASRVVMSIFVNPTQFAAGEDFGSYPRSFEADVAAFEAAGGDIVFAPAVEAMYGAGFATAIHVAGPALAGLEDRARPTHFSGVATVVAKLLNQCRPDIAVFGEKDYQQLKVITRLARDLDLDVKILAAPTLREKDGLAMSSRNVYLSPAERVAAPALYGALAACAASIRAGVGVDAALDDARRAVAKAGFIIDYVEARNAETLEPLRGVADEPIRLLAAAKLGKTRLIDNIAV
ncbi:pantoate/beta-alanine ligase [Methylocella silvestris BL2]|uniref:Pantothenate synthetase n=1 Tax=Methylocella silvestris (strain DSM 15510 / CIP 108128 / LMG 27833 / NCIMB 13906 / BL2) TaxID=395965 RepID=B8EL72_METSB|nr:pantoate--beta-alanine ligase [Methylocella silvestris]ACK49067.1 pantoate/beta-alanine ligase [Methylocella silvestris BL2]